MLSTASYRAVSSIPYHTLTRTEQYTHTEQYSPPHLTDSYRPKYTLHCLCSIPYPVTTPYRAVYSIPVQRLNILNIIRRHTLGNPPPFDIRPPIATIAIHQHEPIPLNHIPLHRAARTILIQRLDVLQLLRAPSRGYCRSDPFAWGWGGARGRVGVHRVTTVVGCACSSSG